MLRPGHLGDYNGFKARAKSLGSYSHNSLGAFGKGYYAPPPSGPPPPIPADYKGGSWSCDNQPRPAETPAGYYHCCPSGWTMVSYGDTSPCKGADRNLSVCGPLPGEATADNAVCCENLKEWVPATGGADPCKAAAAAAGRAVPGEAGTMLAPEIIRPQGSIISPVMLIAGGLAAAGLIGLTVFLKMM